MERLSISDAEELALYFIKHMTMDQRLRLMAERPVLYSRVFPEVSPSSILERVEQQLRAQS